MILVIDNYDSFVYNLVHYVEDFGAPTEVHRNDALSVEAVLKRKPKAVILSPGPCTPNEAGICLDFLARAPADLPILGVCLGHQAIGQAFGGKVVRAPAPWHGKVDSVSHGGTDIFATVPTPFRATRYHSLIVDRDTLPDALETTAVNEAGIVMGMRHRTLPIFGVQFHPESIASEHGHTILGNFLAIAHRLNRVPEPA